MLTIILLGGHMEVINKRNLSTLVYYTLAIMTIVFAAFFGFALIVRNLSMWAKVVYFIWIAGVVGAVIFDIICTSNKEGKTIVGLVVYVLSILAVAMAAILYFMNTSKTGLAVNFFNLFISVSFLSLVTTGFLISTWCVGEHIAKNRVSSNEVNQQQKVA